MGAGNYSILYTATEGATITHGDRNAEHQNHINNHNFVALDDYSTSLAQMQAVTDPYPSGAESLATSGSGELERLRYVIKQITGEAQWYIDPDTDIATHYAATAVHGATGAVVGTTNTQTLTNKTLTTPTIADFTNANHTHAGASTGGGIAWQGLPDGAVVQVATYQTGAVATGTTTMPDDDTIPQNTEGDEYMTLAITPKATTNILVIECTFNWAHTNGGVVGIALFQDSTADALAAIQTHNESSVNIQRVACFSHKMVAGTTSATTFKIRAGHGSTGATLTFNGASGSRKLGGVMASSITITEIKAS